MNVSLPSFPYPAIYLENLSAIGLVVILSFMITLIRHRVWRKLYGLFEPMNR